MGTTPITPDPTVFPTAADLGPVEGAGAGADELNLVRVLTAHARRRPFLVSGGALSDDTLLELRVEAGIAVIEGRYVEWTTQIAHSVTPNTTSRFQMRLVKTGDEVTSVVLEDVPQSTTPPAEDVLVLAVVSAGASAIATWSSEARGSPGHYAGIYVGDGAASRFITPADLTDFHAPIIQVVVHQEAPSDLIAYSAINVPGQRGLNEFGVPQAPLGVGFYLASSSELLADVGAHALIGGMTANTISSYNVPSINDGETDVQVVGLAGVTKQDFFTVEHQVGGKPDGILERAYPVAAGKIGIEISNHSGSPYGPTADLIVRRIRMETIPGIAQLSSDSDGIKVPGLRDTGFRIGHDAAREPTLNESGKRYRYLAFT